MNAEACVSGTVMAERNQRLCDLTEFERQKTVAEIGHVLKVAVDATPALVVLHTPSGWDFELKNPSLTVGELWELAEVVQQGVTQIIS